MYRHPPHPSRRPGSAEGRLVSVEGISGVGKTHLVSAVLAGRPEPARPLLLEEFSRRPTVAGHDLGRDLLRALVAASGGDPFLRGGHPLTEMLLLLAIKTFDYESSLGARRAGRLVVEGRSLDTVAVYQSLILHPDNDDAAHIRARVILAHAARWCPLPDRTILITDDVTAAVRRAEARDRMHFTPEQWRLHHRAAALYERLAVDDPDRIRTGDLRQLPPDAVAAMLAKLLGPADGTTRAR